MTDTATQQSNRRAAGSAKRTGGRKAGSTPKRRNGGGIDAATIFGLAGAFALIATAIILGGSWTAFVDIPAMLIVVGGTFAVTTVSFNLGEVLSTQRIVAKSMFKAARDPGAAALQVIRIAEQARLKGNLSLQDFESEYAGEPFLARGLTMILDGAPGAEAESYMRREMHATIDRHEKGAAILRRAADVAPAMGLIGTLVGLVQMLGNLNDPSTIGPAMAVALLTTFYGAVIGNMVLAPLASKLERKSDEEALINEIYLLAVGSIGRQENPRRLEMLVNTILPPAKRVAYFD